MKKMNQKAEMRMSLLDSEEQRKHVKSLVVFRTMTFPYPQVWATDTG
jgi:hypothetical protein